MAATGWTMRSMVAHGSARLQPKLLTQIVAGKSLA
jgi:hypothetical protein